MKRAVLLLFLAPSLWGAISCTTIDATGYSADQITLVQSLAVELGAAAGTYVGTASVSKSGTNVTVCFDSPSFTVATVITAMTLTNQYITDNAARLAGAAQVAAWVVELGTTTTAAVNAYQNFGSLTQAQINQVTRGLMRILWLRQQLGID